MEPTVRPAGRPVEILAPAGDEEMLRAAVFSGADCVYLGIDGFNARRTAANFGGQALAGAVAFCHARKCKVYAAVNTLVFPGEEEAAQKAVWQAAAAGCDAVIVQDLYTAALVKKLAPGVALHGSTQMSVHSLAGVQMLESLGFDRVILARELAVAEIEQIAAQIKTELEVFVHGALCVCVSGQCSMSAFLGGRSANRGACAGPCRLPFAAQSGCLPGGRRTAPEEEKHHLSLRDLSVLEELPRLGRLGVVSAKIEGRLRGPEYCAVVVDSARKILNEEPYDKKLLQDVFSRSGFTQGWYTGEKGKEMFGVRTKADADASKLAQPRARELYRREAPRVGVEFALRVTPEKAVLTVQDGSNSVQSEAAGPFGPAQSPQPEELLRAALAKTGGTPFYVEGCTLQTGGLFVPGPVLTGLRRQALEALLQLREAPLPPRPFQKQPLPKAVVPARPLAGAAEEEALRRKAGKPLLRARFETVGQMPAGAPGLCSQLVFPLFEAFAVPEALRAQSWLEMPRLLFGAREQKARQLVQQTAGLGFKGYIAQNIAHLQLCKGLPVYGGFGLNVTNIGAGAALLSAGCGGLTLSQELTLQQMAGLAAALPPAGTDALCYGTLPLMATRACPLKNVTNCAACSKKGMLTDRKGENFAVLCSLGVRTIHNPVPLWMADRLREMPTTFATLYFTTESTAQAQQVLQAYAGQGTPPERFTRGLYYKGISD